MTRATGRRRSGIALKNQFRAEREIPERDRSAQFAARSETRAEFRALRAHERRRALHDLARAGIGRRSGSRIDVFGNAAGVVAVKPLAIIGVQFDLRTGFVGECKFRADDTRLHDARIFWTQILYVERVFVAPNACREAKLLREMNRRLREEPAARFDDPIRTRGRENLPLLRRIKVYGCNIVVAHLVADRRFDRTGFERLARVETGDETLVGLFELIHVLRIVEVIGEI